jgi:hypothetical protein
MYVEIPVRRSFNGTVSGTETLLAAEPCAIERYFTIASRVYWRRPCTGWPQGRKNLAITISELQAQLECDHAWRAITAQPNAE